MRTGFCPLCLLGAKKLWCHTVDDDVRGEIFAVVHLRVTPVGEKNALKHLGTIGGGALCTCAFSVVGKFHSLLISAALTVYIPHTYSALWLLPLFQSFFFAPPVCCVRRSLKRRQIKGPLEKRPPGKGTKAEAKQFCTHPKPCLPLFSLPNEVFCSFEYALFSWDF